jgi:drug/metabolite transporter (DMT)-like permease
VPPSPAPFGMPATPGPGRGAAAAAAVTVALWACAFVAIRQLVPVLGPDGLAGARLLVASAGLALAAPLLRVRLPRRADLLRLAGCGLTGMTAYQLLLNAGERTVQAGVASLLVNTAPLFVLPLAAVLLGERPGRRGLAGTAVGFAGAALIALGGGAVDGGPAVSADALLVLGAAAAQATYFVLQKPLLARYSAVEVVTWSTWAGTLICLPVTAPTLTRVTRLDAAGLAALLFLGLGASALGFVCWAYAGARVGVGTATATLYAVAPVALLVDWMALGERPAPLALLGGALALSGVALARSRAARRDPAPPPAVITAHAPEPALRPQVPGRSR